MLSESVSSLGDLIDICMLVLSTHWQGTSTEFCENSMWGLNVVNTRAGERRDCVWRHHGHPNGHGLQSAACSFCIVRRFTGFSTQGMCHLHLHLHLHSYLTAYYILTWSLQNADFTIQQFEFSILSCWFYMLQPLLSLWNAECQFACFASETCNPGPWLNFNLKVPPNFWSLMHILCSLNIVSYCLIILAHFCA